MTSGWIILARSKPDADTIRGVRYPARDQDVNGHSSTVQILRHNRAERLECGLGGSVSRGAGVQHRAQTGCDVDDPSPALAHHVGHDRVRQGQRCSCVDRDKSAPLIGRDLPDFLSRGKAIRSNCTGANPGVVDEDVDAAEPIAGRFGDLLGGGVAGQIGWYGEQVVRVALLIRVRREDRQRLTIAINPSYADAGRQQAPHHRPADATCRSPVTIATL